MSKLDALITRYQQCIKIKQFSPPGFSILQTLYQKMTFA